MISGSWPKSWIATGPSSGCTTSSSSSVLRLLVVDREGRDHLRDREPGAEALGLQAHEPVADAGQRRQHHAVGDLEVPDRPWVVQRSASGARSRVVRAPPSPPARSRPSAARPARASARPSRPSADRRRARAAPRPASRCPPWQAAQNACVTSPSASSGRPSAAAASSVGRAPRSTSRRAAFHCPKAHASSSAVPPPITPPRASSSAPASSRPSISAHVVGAGRPHQRRLAAPAEARVHVRARLQQHRERLEPRAGGAPASRSARAGACAGRRAARCASAGSAASAARSASTSPALIASTGCAPR